MKRTRSLLAFLLACLMCISLAACGGGDSAKSYTLTAADADLSEAPNVIVEPDKAPFNLSGWGYLDIVTFDFKDLADDGEYTLSFNYAKDSGEAIVMVNVPADGQGQSATLPSTGADWSTYKDFTFPDSVYVSGGKISLAIEADYDHESDHLINLRSATLTYVGPGTAPAPEPTPEPEITYADIAGYWQEIDIDDYYYFDMGGNWMGYNPDGTLSFEGTLSGNADGSFRMDEIDLGYFGDIEFDIGAGTATMIYDTGTQFDLVSVSDPFSGDEPDPNNNVVTPDDSMPYVGDWGFLDEDGTLTSLILWSDMTLSAYIDREPIGDGSYDIASGVAYLPSEDGSSGTPVDIYYDDAHDILYLTIEGIDYGFNRME